MVIASELKEGMFIRIEGQIYEVWQVQSKAGAAKLSGVVKTKLRNVIGGRMWEPHSARTSGLKMSNSSSRQWNSCSATRTVVLL